MDNSYITCTTGEVEAMTYFLFITRNACRYEYSTRFLTTRVPVHVVVSVNLGTTVLVEIKPTSPHHLLSTTRTGTRLYQECVRHNVASGQSPAPIKPVVGQTSTRVGVKYSGTRTN
jgi:hypothetical protein